MKLPNNFTGCNVIYLTKRQICDLELLLNGGFNPLKGFLRHGDYISCLETMRLKNGNLWPIPITLPITPKQANILRPFEYVVLKDPTGTPLAVMKIDFDDSIYKYDIDIECRAVFNSNDKNHPYVKIMYDQHREGYTYYLGGEIVDYQLPSHYDFMENRLTPEQTKTYFRDNEWKSVVGFQTRNPMHRSHYELTLYALKQAGENSKLLLHPVVGVTQECDINYHTRVRCYNKLLNHYPNNTAKLCLLPLSMRMAGPREAVWHAIIRKNYGCTHFVVGRDHAGPSYKKTNGNPFYEPYEAQDLLTSVADEIGIKIITSKMIVYARQKGAEAQRGVYVPIDKVDKNKYDILKLSGTEQRKLLNEGKKIPEWFTFPDIARELEFDFKRKNEQGLCLYFVGLSGSGKSTLANATMEYLRTQKKGNKFTLLDGDLVRNHLSKGLTFSREDRKTNVRRIGWVASEIVKHNGIVLVANIAPYKEDRLWNKELISTNGNYIQIWIDTPLKECEKRDAKGLYKLARDGKIKEFTGISDPFETPIESDIIIDGCLPIKDNLKDIIDYLKSKEILLPM